jgi:hypothetical protein
MSTNTQTTPEVTTHNMYTAEYRDTHTSEFLVTRDGQVDMEYHATKDAEARRQAIKAAVHNLGGHALNGAYMVLKGFGNAALEIMEAAANEGRRTT